MVDKSFSTKIYFILLLMLSFILMLPLVITFTNSLMTEADISIHYTTKFSVFDVLDGIKQKYMVFKLIPQSVTLSQYKEILINQPTFLILLMNSAKIAVPVVLGNIFVSLLSAYGFTIWKNPFKEYLFLIYVVVMLMPLQAVLVPNYIVAEKLGILNTYWAIILPGIFNPFGTFLLRQMMKAFPKENFEAAEIDGANRFYIFIQIVIPQMRSGVAALAMLSFIEYWNVVEQAIIFIKDYSKTPLSVYLSQIADGHLGLVFAASCVYMFLPFWFLLITQDDLEKGIELSGIK